MITYSTCTGCGGLLHITGNLDHHNGANGDPACTPKRTRIERLTAEWLAAATAEHDDLADRLEAQITELDNRPPRLLDAALLYASWGWPVFPLRPHTKIPATRHGFKDATTDIDRIRAWWTRHPDANIGLPTGHAFDVIDIDVPAGAPAFAKLAAADGEIHGHAATSSGGAHFYVKPTGRGNSAGGGVDYRGLGGYVVAPPSTLGPKGRSWSWVYRPSPIITGQVVPA